jgi:hypothetical protein
MTEREPRGARLTAPRRKAHATSSRCRNSSKRHAAASSWAFDRTPCGHRSLPAGTPCRDARGAPPAHAARDATARARTTSPRRPRVRRDLGPGSAASVSRGSARKASWRSALNAEVGRRLPQDRLELVRKASSPEAKKLARGMRTSRSFFMCLMQRPRALRPRTGSHRASPHAAAARHRRVESAVDFDRVDVAGCERQLRARGRPAA